MTIIKGIISHHHHQARNLVGSLSPLHPYPSRRPPSRFPPPTPEAAAAAAALAFLRPCLKLTAVRISVRGRRVSLFWEANDPGVGATSLTYNQLLSGVCQLANYLKHIGVKKADAVDVYLPMPMELPITMLACARIGAVHSVVFAGFSAESLAQRIVDCKPKVVITCNAVKRGSKTIHLKDIVDGALLPSAQNGVSIDTCLVYANETAMKRETTKCKEGRDIWWQDVVPKYPTHCEVEWVDTEDPLFLLYTSGSTGKPKQRMTEVRNERLSQQLEGSQLDSDDEEDIYS